jgi:hypothetical protein
VAVNRVWLIHEENMAEALLLAMLTTDAEREELGRYLAGIRVGASESVDNFWRVVARIRREREGQT